MTELDAVQAWKSCNEDIKLGEDLFKQGKYAHALFFLHLAIEKLSKESTNILSMNLRYLFMICTNWPPRQELRHLNQKNSS